MNIFFFCADFFNFFLFRDKKSAFINHVDPYLGVLDAKYQLYRNFSTRIYIDSLQCRVLSSFVPQAVMRKSLGLLKTICHCHSIT